MKQSLQMKMGQSLAMTPQLQQAIKLLQLSTLELQGEIQEALESNPMLEMQEDDGSTPDASDAAGDGDDHRESLESARDEARDAAEDRRERESAADDKGADDDPWEIAELDATLAEFDSAEIEQSNLVDDLPSDYDIGVEMQDISGNAPSADEVMPDDLPVDSAWEDVYEPVAPSSTGTAPEGEGRDFTEFHNAGLTSIQDHLNEQIRFAPLSERDQLIAETIIDAIDNNGYLLDEVDSLIEGLNIDFGAREEGVKIDEFESVLHLIQHLDPAGCGARSAAECMVIQLSQMPDTESVQHARTIAANHLDLLAAHDFARLRRLLKVDEDSLQAAIKIIRSLNPRPGRQLVNDHDEYIVPDVFVKKQKGVWRVELNPDIAPKLGINALYAGMVKRADKSDDNAFMRNNLQEARWFIKSLQSRNETLLRVATAIVERQRAFLEYGDEAMKPLVLRDIAEQLTLHESTISRVTTQKYIHTPRGIFEFKYFFSSHVSTANGGECSATAIRAMIRKFIAAEDATKPLSDSKIASTLVAEGIQVARRTVAKYRESMSIPPSNERKRLN
jgi:RNA polymerase sigma-54 factor